MIDAWCPYCDKLRGHAIATGKLLQTCGRHECQHAAIKAAIIKKYADGNVAEPLLGQYPWKEKKEIDFQDGFANQNLAFADDRSRIRT